jgi:signal peptidase I
VGARRLIIGVAVVALALGLLVVLAYAIGLLKTYRVPSASMAPTLKIDDHLLLTRFGFPFGSTPGRGDIVVFHPPRGALTHQCGIASEPADGHPCAKPTAERSDRLTFVKRAVGLPGDRLYVRNNRAYVNGKPLDEPYTKPGASCDEFCNLPKPIVVPPGHYFLLGDNRGESDDSRDWGPVKQDWLIGRRLLTY